MYGFPDKQVTISSKDMTRLKLHNTFPQSDRVQKIENIVNVTHQKPVTDTRKQSQPDGTQKTPHCKVHDFSVIPHI